jgi:hypothetical protein
MATVAKHVVPDISKDFFYLTMLSTIQNLERKGNGKGRYCGANSALPALKADCTLAPEVVSSVISRGALHQAAREASISEGRKQKARILPTTRNFNAVLGSFTCPKVGTGADYLTSPPKEGTREPDASMLTTRPRSRQTWSVRINANDQTEYGNTRLSRNLTHTAEGPKNF